MVKGKTTNNNKKGNKGSNVSSRNTKKNKKDIINNNIDDEEINSESSVDSEEIDKKIKKQNQKKANNGDLDLVEPNEDTAKADLQKQLSKAISADERRLIMAKTLIGSLEDDKEVDEELVKTKNEHCTEISKNFISKSQEEKYDYQFIKCHISGITCVRYINEHTVVTTSKDRRSFIVDLNTEKKTLLPEFTDKPLNSCVVTKDKKNILFVGNDKRITVFNIESNKTISSFGKAHNDSIMKIELDPENDQVYTCGKDNNLKVWALNSYNNIVNLETFYGHISYIYDLDVLSTNRIVTCGNDANIHQWKIDVQSYLQYKQGDFSYEAINAINKNYFFVGDYLGNLKLFTINKKKQISEVKNYARSKINSCSKKRVYGINNSNDNDVAGLTSISSIMNNSIVKGNDEIEASPIVSMFSFKNTDMLFTGTVNGTVNAYSCNYAKGSNKINCISSIQLLEDGVISAISGNDKSLCFAYSKEAKNGRWDVDYNLKHSGLAVVKLFE